MTNVSLTDELTRELHAILADELGSFKTALNRMLQDVLREATGTIGSLQAQAFSGFDQGITRSVGQQGVDILQALERAKRDI